MSGRFSRDKGARTERALVHLLQQAGFAAERVPLSGAALGRFGGDISVPVRGVDHRIEVKCRAAGFRQLYTWLAEHDALVVKADNRVPLLILPLATAIQFATANTPAAVPAPTRDIPSTAPTESEHSK
jgi:hypothetical protein